MDSGVDTSVTVEELPNPADVSAHSVHPPHSLAAGQNTDNAANEQYLSELSTNNPAADINAPSQADPVFVPVIDDQMHWHPSRENTQSDNEPHIPPTHSSGFDRPDRPTSDSPPPPERQDGRQDGRQDEPTWTERSDEPHAFWAEFEDDLSTPSEAELKEIESAEDGDYSACQRKPPAS